MPKIKEIERTPNPDAMRFVLGEPLTQGVTRSFENATEAEGHHQREDSRYVIEEGYRQDEGDRHERMSQQHTQHDHV